MYFSYIHINLGMCTLLKHLIPSVLRIMLALKHFFKKDCPLMSVCSHQITSYVNQ